jgi:hypothetical protein
MILQISASCRARIIGVSHQRLALLRFLHPQTQALPGGLTSLSAKSVASAAQGPLCSSSAAGA